MTDVVMAAGPWRTNGEMIADVARLGYLNGRVLDATYGLGRFWTHWRPDDLTACDLDPNRSPIGHSVDFTNLPFADDTFDAVVLDGPYKLNGTASGRADTDYGTQRWTGWQGRHELIRLGMTEARRVLRRGGHLLVKCQDQVNGGRVRWQTREFADHGETLGMRLVDCFLFSSYRPQPAGRRQEHARRNVSTLLVFERTS